jgi:hypothetical protein
MSDPANSPRPRAADSDVPMAMRKVYRRLERWRSKRRGRARIPESLWAAAGELARKHGVNQVSRVLHLEFNQLKRMAKSAGRRSRERPAATRPAFVELIAPQPASTECVIEVEGRRGKLRIQLQGTAAAELPGISRALWEMIS